MADTLCGPSNALQNFQKHTTVDRTLQQDRLVGRHNSPTQGFRTVSGQNARVDSEFNAFQAARPGPPQELPHFAPHFAQPRPQFAYIQQAPDWASDFQRLSVATPPPPQAQQQQQRVQASNAASAWHQDFMRQQTPLAQAPTIQQNTCNSMANYSIGGFGGQTYLQTPAFAPSQISQGKQPLQEVASTFDEAAFEQAFEQAQQDMLEVDMQESRQANPEVLGVAARSGEPDSLLTRLRGTRPAIYAAIQVWSETGLGRTEEAVSYLDKMANFERDGELIQDANEGAWIVDSLQRIVDRDAPLEIKTRAEELITSINQRLMSHYPLSARVPMSQEGIWQELEAAGYMRTPELERPMTAPTEPEEQNEEPQPQKNDEDEMARTAGRLLECVADNTSEKFQNSQFFQLMRRLRDREVKVQEDKIIEVEDAAPQSNPLPPLLSSTTLPPSPPSQPPAATMNHPQSAPSQEHRQSTSAIPAIDRHILDHAAMDFETPVYAPDE